jgi:hypothetical protein
MGDSVTPVNSSGSIVAGVGIAIVCQIVAVILSAPLLFTCWGAIQWIGVIPFYLKRKRRGERLTAQGLLIMGFIGLLLNAACDAAVLPGLKNMH